MIVNSVMQNDQNIHILEDDELKDLQECLYKMAVDLDKRCRKYGIRLFLVGGSLLGAVRHKGFIPWDDDMDFAASREDYEKLKNIFASEFANDYELRCPNSEIPSSERFMKIYKRGTVLKMNNFYSPFQPQCVNLDVFPCDYVPENKLCRKIKGIYANALMLIASCVTDHKYRNNIYFIKNCRDGKIYLYLRRIIGFLFSFHKPEKWCDILDSVVQCDQKKQYVTVAFGRKHYFGEMCPANIFSPLKEMLFGEHMFYAPNDSDYYLKNLYGKNYMIPPEKEKRERHNINELLIK